MGPFNKLLTPPKEVLMPSHMWEPLFSLACRVHALWAEKERENLRAKVPEVWHPETTLPGTQVVAPRAHGGKAEVTGILQTTAKGRAPGHASSLLLSSMGDLRRPENVWREKGISVFLRLSQSVITQHTDVPYHKTSCGNSEAPQLQTWW